MDERLKLISILFSMKNISPMSEHFFLRFEFQVDIMIWKRREFSIAHNTSVSQLL